ncbi:hypothetical protein DOTSEDRAFT_68808 [Lecanosticta acicola]|uniref:Uncharacterized protein n=1 Tax=Lecanosticta acicola TaxID=111012 RepID=A0AAI9EDD5_9PEZI|nr:hypothetical protein DOTSEDRAFT_68808 [Lecanosticta acicola]
MPPRINPCSYLPRRLQIVASLTLFVLFCIIFLGTSNTDDFDPMLVRVPYGPTLQEGVHHAVSEAQHVVDHINPFGTPAHSPPPEQANSSSGEASWYSDWKWKNPFSSSVVLDEERAVLPPLQNRPPIYAYYDLSAQRKDEKSRKAESDLLHIWRRAWWAQGFKPVVLSKSEAMNNPLYRMVQKMELDRGIENELMRWLAWGNMGTGILSNFLALPMAPYDDPMLSFLRRGEYPALTRYEGLGNGLFIGAKEHVEAAVKEAVNSPALHRVKLIEEALPAGMMQSDAKHEAIAYYSDAVIKAKYAPIKEKLEDLTTVGDGLAMLPDLINSHLHQTWQNTFTKGVAVLKPMPEHTSAIVEPALAIARNLTECAISPMPASCPPNRPSCKPCVSTSMKMSVPKVFRNDSALFTIGTMPHPYTIQSVVKSTDHLDLKFIRRETQRDIWIQAATNELIGTGQSSFARLPALKDAVASEYGSSRSLWLTAEWPYSPESPKDLEELDWIFGFQLPREAMPSGESETPVPGPERRPKPAKPEYGEGPVPTDSQLQKEESLLEKAKMFIQSAGKRGMKAAVDTKEQIEAWNLADTEAWKFIRAYNARRRIERRQWEEEEAVYLGKGVLNRWIDKIT